MKKNKRKRHSNETIAQRDLSVIWHPCTQMKDHEKLPMIPIRKARGLYLYDFDGNRYIDAISSWWVNLFGHANKKINEAVKSQLDRLEHVLLAGFTHEPALKLAEKLVELTPDGLERVFFADNGSSAVEVALKMSYHYHRNIGKERELFLSLSNSYHGETIGALSVGDVGLYKETYEPLLIKNIQTPVPEDESREATEKALYALEKILRRDGKRISAMIVEPLVQGAGGMHIYSADYLKEARKMTESYGIHLIADEIMTGFGRTGTMFACEQADIVPDFMTLSKGLTGGYMPLSTVMVTEDIYSAFYCDYSERGKSFLHSHSYTGNPLACSAALATLEIFEKENVLEKNRKKSAYIYEKLKKFRKLENVEKVRNIGMIAAVELSGYSADKRVGLEVYKYALRKGVLLRPLGNVIYFMPPYIIKRKEIDKMMDTAYRAIESLTKK
jgi:adenosylmethionine-8-amino-7-oxononanoate aminotransferase